MSGRASDENAASNVSSRPFKSDRENLSDLKGRVIRQIDMRVRIGSWQKSVGTDHQKTEVNA